MSKAHAYGKNKPRVLTNQWNALDGPLATSLDPRRITFQRSLVPCRTTKRSEKKKECVNMLYFSKGRAFQERNFFVLRERERERLPQAWLGQGNWGSSLGRSEIFHVFFIYSLDENFDQKAKNAFSKTVTSWLSLYKTHSSLPAIRVVSSIPIQNVQKHK